MRSRRLAALTVLTALHLAPGVPDDAFDGRAGEEEFEVDGVRGEIEGGPGTTQVASTPREYLRAIACTGSTPMTSEDQVCSPLASGDALDCPGGMTPIPPLWMREQLDDGTWSAWTAVAWYSCPSEDDLFALIEREWTELRPDPSEMSLQPDTGVVYATVPTIAIADDGPRLHSAILLGADVDIRATPATFTWAWGDGAETTTADPGAPYPDATVTHAYGRALDTATVTLTTTWSGEYRVADGTWAPFDTTIATTSPGLTLTVLHPRAVLVEGPLG